MTDSYHGLTLVSVIHEVVSPLSRYLRRYAGDSSLADDLLQETLVRISRGFANFDGRSNVRTWAFSIATRVAADHFRKPEHRAEMVDFDEVAEQDLPASEDRLAEDRLVIDEMSACVREIIDGLPDDQRAALVLHDLEDMSARQVADICEISIATAKIRIHRARSRLRDALKKQCDFYRDQDSVFRCDRKHD